jgi:hypothetical protein
VWGAERSLSSDRGEIGSAVSSPEDRLIREQDISTRILPYESHGGPALALNSHLMGSVSSSRGMSGRPTEQHRPERRQHKIPRPNIDLFVIGHPVRDAVQALPYLSLSLLRLPAVYTTESVEAYRI